MEDIESSRTFRFQQILIPTPSLQAFPSICQVDHSPACRCHARLQQPKAISMPFAPPTSEFSTAAFDDPRIDLILRGGKRVYGDWKNGSASQSPPQSYSQDQNYWRFTDFFTKSSNRPKHASNSTVWGISLQPGHFFSF